MMSLPSTEALTIGWRLSASAAALTKKLMKPSLMPLAFSNCSPSSLRIAATLARLISLNEVSIAIEFFDCIRRSAIFARMRVIGTRSSARGPDGALAAAAGAGAADVVDEILLGHRATAAAAGHLGRIDLVLGRDAAAGGGERIDAGGGSGCGWSGRRLRRDLLRPGGRSGSRGRARTFLEDGEHLRTGHRCARIELDFLEHAIGRCRHFEHDLVGFEIDEVLVALDRVANLLVPGGDRGVGDGFGQYRNFHFNRHVFFTGGSKAREHFFATEHTNEHGSGAEKKFLIGLDPCSSVESVAKFFFWISVRRIVVARRLD